VGSKGHPIDILLEIEALARKNAKGLPQQVESKDVWSGIAFRVGDVNLIAPLTQVNEILHYPSLTLVPGTLTWVKGLANIRGTLLPIMDLRNFLGQSSITPRSQSRIMVIHQGELSAGLLVDEVLGLKHFDYEEKASRVKKLDESMKPYIHGAFQRDKQTWYVFNMAALADDPSFYKVAV
jgi:twitching motility protein PilI